MFAGRFCPAFFCIMVERLKPWKLRSLAIRSGGAVAVIGGSMYILHGLKRDIKHIISSLHQIADIIVDGELSMTNKIDQLNDALAKIETGVGTLYDTTKLLGAGLQKNQTELKAILEKLQAGETDVTPQLEKAIAINEKLLAVTEAAKQAQETVEATDAMVDDVEAELPGNEPQEPEQPAEPVEENQPQQ